MFPNLLVLGTSDVFATAEATIREIVRAHTNMDRLAISFQEFLVKMVIDGLRKA